MDDFFKIIPLFTTMASLLTAIIILSVISTSVDGIKVLRNILAVGDKESIGGASLVNVSDKISTEDLTICLKFNLQKLDGWESSARLLTFADWKNESVDVDFQLMFFGLWYPQTFFGFGHPQTQGSYGTFLLTDLQDRTEIWTPNKWTQMCISYRKRDAFLRVTIDGSTMNVNRSEPNLKDTVIPQDFLTKIHVGRCSYDFKGGCSTPGGLISDFNIWSRPLSEQEAIDWTSCKLEEKGDLVDWTTAQWKLVNMVKEDMTKDEICKPQKPGHVIFPEPRNMTTAIDICRKMKAIVSEVNYGREQRAMDQMYHDFFGLNHAEAAYWSGYWDEYMEGQFESVNDGSLLGSHTPWYSGEPNGGKVENCLVVWPNRGKWNDVDCAKEFATFCNFEEAPYLKLRGLCSQSVFDLEYSWTINFINGRHSFSGFQNTLLSWNIQSQMWNLNLLDNPNIYATLESQEYPLGTNKWTIYNEPCYGNNVTLVELSFNTCNEDEFNCLDGTCISITQRCDGKIECPDKTDEISCHMVEIDESYIKDMPAPAIVKRSLNNINISIDVLSIQEINEVDSFLALQFDLHMVWFDPRITFNNLKTSVNLNTVNSGDKSKIWIPEVVFQNTMNKEESKHDFKSYITIDRQGPFIKSRLQDKINKHTFKGSENPLKVSRVYSTQFICDFDMGYYPFDIQTCYAVFVMKGNTGFFAKLVVDQLAYLGPIDLTQYYVQSWKIWESQSNGTTIGDSIKLEISLGRRLLNELLITYLPTILICIVAFCTNFFKPFFFEAIVTVNLTSLLVLTTLFISVSSKLPKTSYVKMIDIWLIFVLCVPFLETILHTIIDGLREEENIVVNHHGGQMTTSNKKMKKQQSGSKIIPIQIVSSGKDRNVELIARNELQELDARKRFYQKLIVSNEKITWICEGALKIGLPLVFITFTVCYFIVGFSNQGK